MLIKKIEENEYKRLLESDIRTKQDMFLLASYPYVSLLSKYNNMYSDEIRKVREIEDDNISTFLHVVSIVFGIGSEEEISAFRKSLNVEPLRSAVIAARQEYDPSEKEALFFELACKILLSVDEQGRYSRLDATKVRIQGKIPSWPFSTNRQKIADEWYANFVDIKLKGMKKVYKSLGVENAYKFVVSSTLHSLYFFAPSRYNISACSSEDEALHEVFRVFNYLKNKRL